jgi:hypothetical protein
MVKGNMTPKCGYVWLRGEQVGYGGMHWLRSDEIFLRGVTTLVTRNHCRKQFRIWVRLVGAATACHLRCWSDGRPILRQENQRFEVLDDGSVVLTPTRRLSGLFAQSNRVRSSAAEKISDLCCRAVVGDIERDPATSFSMTGEWWPVQGVGGAFSSVLS